MSFKTPVTFLVFIISIFVNVAVCFVVVVAPVDAPTGGRAVDEVFPLSVLFRDAVFGALDCGAPVLAAFVLGAPVCGSAPEAAFGATVFDDVAFGDVFVVFGVEGLAGVVGRPVVGGIVLLSVDEYKISSSDPKSYTYGARSHQFTMITLLQPAVVSPETFPGIFITRMKRVVNNT